MDDDGILFLCGLLACVALAGCSAFGGVGEVTPANDTVSVETTVADTDGAFHVPENDTVSILLTSSGDREEIPFEDYACQEARTHANGVVQELIAERLNVDSSGYATGVAADGVDVFYYSELSVPPSDLEKVTPERVVVTVHVFEQETRCDVPVSISDGGSGPEPL